MLSLLKRLFPINRSLTGEGVRKTLSILREELGRLELYEVPSGTQAFDWIVPDEWNINEAYIVTPSGDKICDYQRNNLHLVGYSMPAEVSLTLDQLQPHLHSLPKMPDAIPYVTSYYHRNWGFCLQHNERVRLADGQYKVVIRGRLEPGYLSYGELLIPATVSTKKEVFFSTYICHPSMANNELSGPVVATYLGKWLMSLPNRRYNYRFVFAPETIGSIIYLSRNYKQLKERVVAGFNLTCVGDDRCYSYVPSRSGSTLADRIAKHVLHHHDPEFKRYSFLDRGSDERQYCAPGIDLPFVTMCRSKYHCYPEYHTSFDNLELVSESGLRGALSVHKKAIMCLERNRHYCYKNLGEPQLSKRGLYPSVGTRELAKETDKLMNILAYCDGATSLLEVSDRLNTPLWELTEAVDLLLRHDLLVGK
jgi:aminopeptidase-like protein